MYVTVNHNHNHLETGELHGIMLIKHTTSYYMYYKLFKFIFSDLFPSLRIVPVNLLRINLVLLITFCQSV